MEELTGGVMVVEEVNWVLASEARDMRVTPIEVSSCNILGGLMCFFAILSWWMVD